MRFLLDTHVALWAVIEPERLPPTVREAIADEANMVAVSVVTLWEIAIKHRLRRGARGDMTLSAAEAAHEFASASFEFLDVTIDHALAVADLPTIHGDPFDRMLIAQAKSEPMRLVTHDALVASYGDWIERI